MTQQKKNDYVSLSFKIEPLGKDDIISTSGFLGGDDPIYTPTNPSSIDYDDLNPYPVNSAYATIGNV